MKLTWLDTYEIALMLDEKYPDIDPRVLRFTDLHKRITNLEDFDDDPDNSNEKILEDIQMKWIDEK